MPSASVQVVCTGCEANFWVHKGCAKKPSLLCASCKATTITITPVIPLLSSFFGNGTDPGIQLIGDGVTCSSCSASYQLARKYCEDRKLAGDSKNAHCVIPQTILKRSGRIVIDFYNIVCRTKIAREAKKGKARITLKMKQSIRAFPRKLFGSSQETIDDYVRDLLNDELDYDSRSGDGEESKFYYFTEVTPTFESLPTNSKALQIIGQSNLNEFYVGRQCAVCEIVQGDLPLLERLFIAMQLLDALPYVKKLDQQVTTVTKLIAKREQEDEATFNRFVRKVNEGNRSRRPVLLAPSTVVALRQLQLHRLEITDRQITNTYQRPVAAHIRLIENPWIRQWAHLLVGRSFPYDHLKTFVHVYVGKHLLAAMQRHEDPLAFMMSWLDSDLLPEIHERIEAGYRESLPLEVARQLWPVFVQYYAASLFAACQKKLALDEIDRLVELCQEHLASLMSGEVGTAWKK